MLQAAIVGSTPRRHVAVVTRITLADEVVARIGGDLGEVLGVVDLEAQVRSRLAWDSSRR